MTFASQKPKRIERLTPAMIREVEKANAVRKANGLRLLKIQVRACLACGYLFESAAARTCGCTKARNIIDVL